MMGRGHEKGWSAWIAILITRIFLRSCYVQYITESVIVNPVILIHALGRQAETKGASVLARLPRSLGPRHSLNCLSD